tara:strand:- start:202 stop:399 length:198 start_codon:yes stop_codon:yes gene_type:complete
MTKKDYVLLANIIKSNSSLAIVKGDPKHIIKYGEFIFDLCKILKNDNPNFNEIKFREAAGQILSK